MKQITLSHWHNIMNKLIYEKGMTHDNAFIWMKDKFIVNDNDISEQS